MKGCCCRHQSLVGVAWTWLGPARQIGVTARKIERQFPELDAALITALEQAPRPGQRLNYLQLDTIRRAIYHSYENSWVQVVPGWQLIAGPVASTVGLAALAASLASLMLYASPGIGDGAIPFDEVVMPSSITYELVVVKG